VIWIVLMLLAGVLMSAFFSGSETGFYRVTRVRLVLDSRSGDPISRGLLWLTNNPSLFVATTLIGNNLANYVTSLAIVLLAQDFFSPDSYVAELAAPIVLAPVLFVYGELLPKNLFFYAPNLLLRRAGPLFLVFGVLVAPVSALLWGLGRFVQWILGESPERVRLTLARTELARVLEEGQEAGILTPVQRNLAQGLFAIAHQPVTNFCMPAAQIVSVRRNAKKSVVLRLARRQRVAAVVVQENGRATGYVQIVDLYLEEGDSIRSVRPLLEIPRTDTHIAALTRLQSAKQTMARVVDRQRGTVGLLSTKSLTEPLFRDVG